MSVETLILLAFFVLVPLLQGLWAEVRKRVPAAPATGSTCTRLHPREKPSRRRQPRRVVPGAGDDAWCRRRSARVSTCAARSRLRRSSDPVEPLTLTESRADSPESV